MAYAAVGAPV